MKELKESLSVRDSIQNRLSFAMVVVMVFVMCINFFIFEVSKTIFKFKVIFRQFIIF